VGDVLSLVAYRLRKLQRATRAVHNRAAACVAPAVAFSKTSFNINNNNNDNDNNNNNN